MVPVARGGGRAVALIRRILLALALGFVGAVVGAALGEWYADTQMPDAGLDALGPILLGLGAGAFSGIAAGIAIATRLGRRDRS